MKKQIPGKRMASALVAALLLAGLLAGCGTPASPPATSIAASQPAADSSMPMATATPSSAPARDSYAKTSEYLSIYFGIDTNASWDAASYSKALAVIAGEEAATVTGDLTALSAIKASVSSAAQEELAKSYTEEKTKQRLEEYGVDSTGDTEMDAYLASGLDASLYTVAQAKEAAAGGTLTKELAATLLMSVAEANACARNYLGYSNEIEMDSRLQNMWASFQMFDQPELTEIARKAVEQGITTGYNLKNDRYNARFLPDLTIQYGHSDIKHAHQLLALLNSENIVAKVQLEPKVSVYQYLLEWGTPPEATPTYEVRKFSEELYLVFAVEYDLQLEFDTVEDLMQFDSVITTYAKKFEGNEDAVGLIYASWWQPLYTVTRDDMPADAFFKIHDCVMRDGEYTIHPFCLDENFDETVKGLNALNPNYQVEAVTRYCNKAFYNYMTGDDFQ